MNPKRVATLLALAGGLLVPATLAYATLGSFQVAVFPVLVVATGYLTVGVCAKYFMARSERSFPLAVLPGVVTALVSLGAAQALGLLKTSDPLVFLLVAGPPATVALAFPLGVAARPRTQWTAVGLLLAAASPLFGVVGSTVLDIKAEDAGALLILAVVAVVLFAPFVLPPYFLGRSVRRSLDAPTLSPRPPLVAAAVPLVLLLSTLLVVPYMLSYPPVLAAAMLALGALAFLGVRFVRAPV